MTSSSPYSRTEIADHVAARLEKAAEALSAQFHLPGRIASCVVDEVLPDAMARRIHAAFPPTGRMMFKNSIKERKYVAAQMDAYDPILEEAVYAFQDPRVVALVSKITGLSAMEADAELYAGGISAMPRGAYLKPHLDNSHDKARERYRVLNLLYYVTPDWDPANGGNLQLWDQGPRGPSRTLESRFNTLVLMITGRQSWHSVNEVTADQSRCCVSNYYFSKVSPEGQDYFHATSFRGEPGQPLADTVMRADNAVRTTVLKVLGDKLYHNPHVYRRGSATVSPADV
jgi:Rps23 Pro-64 3,4-dihydroxylase Tpa1-like proline 4-hydroxylase